jgi:hypothetical protein
VLRTAVDYLMGGKLDFFSRTKERREREGKEERGKREGKRRELREFCTVKFTPIIHLTRETSLGKMLLWLNLFEQSYIMIFNLIKFLHTLVYLFELSQLKEIIYIDIWSRRALGKCHPP